MSTTLSRFYHRTRSSAASFLFRAAEAALSQAVEDQESNWGPIHRQLVEPLAALAGVYAAQSRVAEADSTYRRALHVAEVSSVPGHPDIAKVRIQYASLLRTEGKGRQPDSLEYRPTLSGRR